MTTAVEIPLSPQAQTLQVALGGITYTFTLVWCDPNQAWTLDIGDAQGNPIVRGIALITGADLLQQYAYLAIGGGGQLIVQTDTDPDAVPTFANLGVTSHLYWVTEP